MSDTAKSTLLNHKLPRVVALLVVLTSQIACDQVTKELAEHNLNGRPRIYLGDVVRLQLAHNPGAFLGMGHALPDALRLPLLTLGVSAILCGVLAFVIARRTATWPLVLGAGLVVAGGLGNLIDRIWRGGVVTDFMNVGIGPLRTGIFNVADVHIMLGAALLLWATRGLSTATPTATAASDTAST
jgi:signal peptidase II